MSPANGCAPPRIERSSGPAKTPTSNVAEALGWDDAQRQKEIDHYVKRVEAERQSQQMPDDETADAARMGAPDVVPVTTASPTA